jgi:quinol monooxygenase YgiN
MEETHSLHSKTELKLQWIAIFIMAIGLMTSIYYHANTIKDDRIKAEMQSHLHLNNLYNKLLFTLIQNDSEVFKQVDDPSLQENKYIIYEMFEVFATVDAFKEHFAEMHKDILPIWQRRMDFFLSKPAVRYAWESHRSYAKHIYHPGFLQYVEDTIACLELEEL